MSEPTASHKSNSPPPDPSVLGDGDTPEQPPRKRQRIRLSCLECRRRKLSCDRGFPCDRCVKSGTPERCSYETRPGLAPPAKTVTAPGLSPTELSLYDPRLPLNGTSVLQRKEAAKDHDRIRRLELEVSQLKTLLATGNSLDGTTVHTDNTPAQRGEGNERAEDDNGPPVCSLHTGKWDEQHEELRFFRGKEFKTRYYGPQNAFMAFKELSGLSPFMKETGDEWLKPLQLQNRKDRGRRKEEREKKFAQSDPALEGLLPLKEEADPLVNLYLDQFEQLNRILHIPTFRKEYAKFWDPTEPRYAAFTVLVMCIMAVSSCLHSHEGNKIAGPSSRMVSTSHENAEKWIKASEEWLRVQSMKHRKLIHYQIACLLYLGKRVNTMKKKRFWSTASNLIQDGITVGLHREPPSISNNISIYSQEMRRRIWATMQEFDVQASFDHGLPTIQSALHYDVEPPRNIDDDEFDEDSTELPPSRPVTDYTYCSYQHLTRTSLPLRLELSRIVSGPPGEIEYEQIIRYTNEITQEIDSLPSWDVKEGAEATHKQPLLAYTMLHIQLRQYIIALHQSYLRLRKTNSKYQYSEIFYYNAARDMVLLHDKLAQLGIRTLYFLREDSLTLAINLCSVTMLQPRGSTNMITVNSQHTLKLLEKCVALKEDRLLRCGNNEPWGYSVMCAAVGLLETHLDVKTVEAAKASAAERFINLHYKLLAGQDPPTSSQQSDQARADLSRTDPILRPKSVTPYAGNSATQYDPVVGSMAGFTMPWIVPTAEQQQMQPVNSDLNLDLMGFNLNDLWGGADTDPWDFS